MPQTQRKPETKAKSEETEKPKRETKVLAPLDFSSIKVRETTADDMRNHRRTKGTRDPEQVATDNLVRQAYDKWVESGKPTDWLASSGFHVRLPEGQFDTFVERVRRSGLHFSLAVRFGQRRDADGYAEVVMVVKDRVEKTEKKSEESGEEAAESVSE